MGSFLLLLFFIAIFIVIVALGFLRSIFRFGKRSNPFKRRQDHSQGEQNVHHANPLRKKSKKIIQKDEGEYVDFEEIE
ncbi:MAG TPA: DUF4834 family protein [Paludibacter sp.]|nr:DUF4834 family protein [Paludibacter sp.]